MNTTTKLYMRSPRDVPHAEFAPGISDCGRSLTNARTITDKQAQVWLGDRRCPVCFPQHSAQILRTAANR